MVSKHNIGASCHKLMTKYLKVPNRSAHSIVRSTKTILSPSDTMCRRRLSSDISSRLTYSNNTLDIKGYHQFDNDYFNDHSHIVSICKNIFIDAKKNKVFNDFISNDKKQFLLTVASNEDFISYSEIIKFAISRQIIDTVAVYLRTIPVLSAIKLWWSPQNSSSHSSQLFHFDNEDSTQIKLFICITDTFSHCGPLIILPAPISKLIQSKEPCKTKRYSDKNVEKYIKTSKPVEIIGSSGTGAFVDTSKCLHYGSRKNTTDRLMLMVQYLRHNSPYASGGINITSDLASSMQLDAVQKLLLNSD